MILSTPGPWHWTRENEDIVRVDSKDGAIATIHPTDGSMLTAQDNARLIAQAPKMLALLKRVNAESMNGTIYRTINDDIQDFLRTIL